MLTLLGWLIHLALGGALAAAVFQLVKAKQGGWRALGWVVGVGFSWYCLKALYFDVRSLSIVSGLIDAYLLATTVACLAKGVKTQKALPYEPILQRKRLPPPAR
ncbi:MAG: hypothetical protein HY928_09530 [Elusimicrobia bacterium]|nr:hypothetical protein [Elusimicrobiota bacterium]